MIIDYARGFPQILYNVMTLCIGKETIRNTAADNEKVTK